MLPIEYTTGDATAPQTGDNKIIAHVCNDMGAWGAGFVRALSHRWPEPEREFRRWYRDRATEGFRLGAVQLVQTEPDLWVANLVGQHGIRTRTGIRTDTGTQPTERGTELPDSGPPIRYDAVREALHTLAEHALRLHASVHMPRIGCGLAGGTWDRVEPLIAEALGARDIRTVVYDHA
ncbi:macro domain-containing protein [Streptomyces sp. TRM49041]|uniref:macro domain-containing protein n=1 Tax=Streptomyces sp. TRM49041 TaxID=2603216 RepID=UPI0011EC8009|nr:macro domain-containing protein [Streptomyces sp. TRM49041]